MLLCCLLSGFLVSAGAATPPPSPLEVHEWGLLDVSAGVANLLAGPPPALPVIVRKPILYFHLRKGAPASNIDVSVKVPAGSRIAEHFPQVKDGSSAEIAWSSVRVKPGPCRGASAPERDMRQCPGLGKCETAELARYETDDADCLEYQGRSYNHLFYRTAGTIPALPLAVRVDRGEVIVSNPTGVAVPGPLLYLHAGENGAEITVASPPLGNGDVRFSGKGPHADANEARRALDAAMAAAGLTPAERESFGRAWYGELFPNHPPANRRMRAAVLETSPDAVVFVLPESFLSEVAQVSVSPGPVKLSRFILVRMGL